jgi:hypothetical protein
MRFQRVDLTRGGARGQAHCAAILDTVAPGHAIAHDADVLPLAAVGGGAGALCAVQPVRVQVRGRGAALGHALGGGRTWAAELAARAQPVQVPWPRCAASPGRRGAQGEADRGGLGDTWQHLILAHVLATHGRDEALRSARAAAGAAGALYAAELLLFLALSRESARTPITGLRVADVLAFLRILPHFHEALARCARKARPTPPFPLSRAHAPRPLKRSLSVAPYGACPRA